MIQILKNILGIGPKVDFKQLVKDGAQIIDVRTVGEFRSGHIKGAVNLPLHNLHQNISKIKTGKPVITCCASGMRSASAKRILKTEGFQEVHNGGGWVSLQSKIS
ncbi:MAG: rhodanese-like domain-containing protein [Flavobacteriales bacterium]|nr:rhodanese-like domain-containing protein [Flavobacteriales bacterium]